jgi:hypothetical protein
MITGCPVDTRSPYKVALEGVYKTHGKKADFYRVISQNRMTYFWDTTCGIEGNLADNLVKWKEWNVISIGDHSFKFQKEKLEQMFS